MAPANWDDGMYPPVDWDVYQLIECAYCGKDFTAQINKTHKYCSSECRRKEAIKIRREKGAKKRPELDIPEGSFVDVQVTDAQPAPRGMSAVGGFVPTMASTES